MKLSLSMLLSRARSLMPLLIVVTGVLITWVMLKTAPEAGRKEPQSAQTVVEVEVLKKSDFEITVRSHGTVAPQTQSTLVAEVSGQVTEVADNFNEGGFFEPGDVLLKIDSRDYQSAVVIARSELAQQKLKLNQEMALAEQATQDWKRLGGGDNPTDLALRKPQLTSARAAVDAAAARLRQAEVNLQRTKITAPYAGRLLEKNVDIGQFVSPGTVLAKVYAIDTVEIKLPLSDQQIGFLDIPEQYRGQQRIKGPAVTLRKGKNQWQATIVRSAAAIDDRSRLQYVVAQAKDPYSKDKSGGAPLKVGQFVDAEIAGSKITGVFVLPRSALRENRDVLLVEDGKLKRQPVAPLWTGDKKVVIREGLQEGDQIVVSPVAYAVDGMPVIIQGQEKSNKKPGAKRQPEGA